MIRISLIAAALGLGLLGLAVTATPAQDDTDTPPAPDAESPNADAAQPAGDVDDADADGGESAEQVLNELLRRRQENPLIEPARPVRPSQRPEARGPMAEGLRGTAPGARRTELRREGDSVIMRRGRMVRAQGGASSWMFTFIADSDGLGDPPMYLMPCQLLEDMEEVVAEDEQTDRVFIITGQVFVYHNANYLLPTVMQLAPPARGAMGR